MTKDANAGRTAAATAARIRAKDEELADRLRSHGWIVYPPDSTATVTSTYPLTVATEP